MIPATLTQTTFQRGRTRSRMILAGAVLLTAALSAQAQSTPTGPAAPPPETPKDAKAAEVKPLPAPAAAAEDTKEEEETIVLSPFEVVADTKGYYAANSMSGTRFNTSLQDLAAPVSVMTKEQMQDFGMLDLNDVFLYTANAEGTGTYSDFVMNRNGEMTDNVSLNPNTANRVRGIASANVSYGNFETSRRMPLDPIILDRVEVSRGPNANVFGLGNPSGTVNQVPVYANLSKNRISTEFRWDSYDGHRVSIDVNRVIVEDKLAVRFSAVDQTEGFVRKPSGMDTTRYNGMLRFKPFPNTTFNAAFLSYESEGQRPNFTPPRDFISYWIEMGRPTWHPVNQTVRVGSTVYDHAAVVAAGNSGGTRTDAFISQIGQPWNAFNRSGGQFQRSNLFIDPSGTSYWSMPNNTTGSTPLANTGSGAAFIRFMGTSPGPNGASGKFLNQPLFTSVPSIKDKSVYDYESINLAAPNYTWDEVESYYYTLDHFFLNDNRQMLAAQVGFFREDAEQYRKVPIGDAGTGGQNGQLWVDVNETYLNGAANPNLGRPYIGVGEPIYSYLPAKWDTTRAQLAYSYDFTQSDGWIKNLGKHLISPYYEYKYRVQRKYSYREALASDHTWLATGQPGVPTSSWARANQANAAGTGGPLAGPNQIRTFQRFYVGDASGTNVDYAPGSVTHGAFAYNWGSPTTTWRAEPALLEELATSNNTGGSNNSKNTIKTEGFVIQSQLLEGRLVPTYGLRRDRVYTKFGATPPLMVDSNTKHNFESINAWSSSPYMEAEGKTETLGVVVRPFRDFGPVNKLYNSGSGVSRFFGELLRDSVFYYNQSDNFIPMQPAYDLFFNELPNQTGEGEDWGMWFNLFDSKLSVRINVYNNKQVNARDGDANTIAQRLLRYDLDSTGDTYRLHRRATDWWSLTNPTWTAEQVDAKVHEQMQMTSEDYERYRDLFSAGLIAATNDITAKGTEIEINYNPNSYWTISANGEKKESINTNLSTSIDDYIAYRRPIWESIVDQNYDPNLFKDDDVNNSRGWTAASQTVPVPNPNHLWWIHRYGTASQSASENFAVNVQSPWGVFKAQEGKSRPSVRQYAFRLSTNYRLAGITDNSFLKNFSVGGALRWEDKGAIGYYGVEEYPAVITALDGDRPIYDEAHTYIDVNLAYKTKLFDDKCSATFRLNIRNLQESGRLQGTGAFPNGEIHSWRIIDPRQFVMSATFDF
jgi:hypothetical protein